MNELGLNTQAVHAGYSAKNGEPRQMPIIQSTTFKYESSEQMGRLFDLTEAGYFYSRLANPTCDGAAAKLTALEGGVAGMLTSSGQAALFFSVFNIAQAGDHVISTANLYGGTYNLFAVTMAKMGIEFSFVDQDLPLDELKKFVRPNTKAVFGETLANPGLSVLDIEKFATLAHDAGVPLIIDNTFPTPIFCRPFEHGADIVTHSTTKYLDGSGIAVGGAIIDSGNFDWLAHADKFPGLTTPDESYHGVSYAQTFGKGAYITKAVVQLMRDLGASQSPQSAFYLYNGISTLELRMKRHADNALQVARYLKEHPRVKVVNYPGLEDDRYHELAKKYLPEGQSGVLTFEVDGSREEAARLQDAFKLIAIATHVAEVKSCVLHPASTTHRQLSDEALAAAGVTPTLIRLSVGIENVEDIIADLSQALKSL